MHFCLRILTLQGMICLASREGNTAPFVLVDEWLGHPSRKTALVPARAELLRLYLRCYGPSTPGTSPPDSRPETPQGGVKTVGDRSTILAGCEIVGLWRPRKSGKKLAIGVQPFGSIPTRVKKLLQEEGEQVASPRGAASVDIDL